VTPLYRLKTTAQRVGEVLTALAEGLDISAAVRVFGHRHTTITTWLTRAGEHSATLHNCTFHNLHLPHIQLDELRTRLRSRAQAVWLWVAVDPLSKVIPVLHLDGCTQAAAHAVIHKLRQHLTPSCISVLRSDGLNLYFYALTAHFGHWVAATGRRARQWQVAAGLIYGQVKKTYRRHRLVRVTQVMRCGTRAALKAALTELGLSGLLNTAFVERLKKDAAAERRGSRAPHLVNTAGGATVDGPPGMVARLLPLRAAASVATSCTGTADCAGWAAAAPAVPPADTRNGRWPDAPALDGAGPPDTPLAVFATRHGLSAGGL
jgi:IS1 family transposase